MIECVEGKIYKKNIHKKRKFRFFSFFIIIILILYPTVYFNKVVYKLLEQIIFDYSYSVQTECVNKSILAISNQYTNYSEIVHHEKNKEGDIVLINIDSFKTNELSRKIVSTTEKLLVEKLKNGVPVPIFAFSGIKLISGLGRKINYKTITIASVDCSFNSKFISAGINQTMHSIIAVIKSKIFVDIPLKSKEIELKTEYVICESMIIGKVPEIYLNGNIS
ncbi:MAG: hypothetical protein MJ066_04580 [Clostridia bacterium]|nr:hypothetical protein [Clostridia bacterium]